MGMTLSRVEAMIPVARPFVAEEEEAGVLAVLRSGWLTQGQRVEEFERKFADYVGSQHAIAVSSCTTALQVALWAYGIGEGDEVICPSLSFIATANAITSNRATPIFADIERDSFNIDPSAIEALITPRTRAIMVVHQIGLPANLSVIKEIADRHHLILIEDAACAIGSEYKGLRVGSPVGNLACFSFHPRKILTTGEGGMITTNDPLLAQRLRSLRQHSMSLSDVARHQSTTISTEVYPEVGFNYRMTDLQAAIGLAQLGRLPALLARRRELASRYTQNLQHLSWIQTPRAAEEYLHNYQSYMITLRGSAAAKRNDLMQYLLSLNISTRRSVMAIHREAPYRLASSDDQLPNTSVVADTGIILPLFHQMTLDDHDRVIEALDNYHS